MKIEINFYQIDDVIAKSMAPLLVKVLEEKKKALIFSKDKAKIKEIDDGLWQFSKTKFVPHGTIFENDIDFKRQPVLISDKKENANDANYLIMTEKTDADFIKNFERAFYFYDSMQFDAVKDFARAMKKDFAINSYKKNDGKWEKFGL